MTLDGGRGVCNVQLVISMLLASTEPFEATLWAVPSVPGVAPYKIRVTAAPTEVWRVMPLIAIVRVPRSPLSPHHAVGVGLR